MNYYEDCLKKSENGTKVSDVNGMELLCTKNYNDGAYSVYRSGKQLFIQENSGIFELISNTSGKLLYSPDKLHINKVDINKSEVDDKMTLSIECWRIPHEFVKAGMSCEYRGIKLTVINENMVSVEKDGFCRMIPVDNNNEYVYKFMKTKIKAIGGAFGFYGFMEQIAEQGKRDSYPFWNGDYMKMDKLFNELCPKQILKQIQDWEVLSKSKETA